MALNNYVKFIRGSAAAWAALTEKNPDTLYFITTYADEANSIVEKVDMYLGDQLISNGTSDLPQNIQFALNDITDVNLNDVVLTDGMVLSYSATEGQWIPKEITVENSEDLGALKAQLATLIGTVEGDKTLSVREIAAQEVATIVDEAPEAYNTLKEIADWITNHPEDVSEINSKIADIEKELFEEVVGEDDILIKKSKIANLQEELGLAKETVEIVSTEISSLEELLGAKKDEDGNLTGLSKIETIENILGIDENENGEIIITSAPIGNLEDLLLYQNSEDNKPTDLVDAINILTENMTWKNL